VVWVTSRSRDPNPPETPADRRVQSPRESPAYTVASCSRLRLPENRGGAGSTPAPATPPVEVAPALATRSERRQEPAADDDPLECLDRLRVELAARAPFQLF